MKNLRLSHLCGLFVKSTWYIESFYSIDSKNNRWLGKSNFDFEALMKLLKYPVLKKGFKFMFKFDLPLRWKSSDRIIDDRIWKKFRFDFVALAKSIYMMQFICAFSYRPKYSYKLGFLVSSFIRWFYQFDVSWGVACLRT